MPSTKCGFNDAPSRSGADCLAGFGPTLSVNVGFDATYDPAVPTKPPALPPDQLWALIDTGAVESCIDSDLAMRLNLPVVDRRQISGAHGAKEVNVHLAHIHIPRSLSE
jgi:hypothetical protein